MTAVHLQPPWPAPPPWGDLHVVEKRLPLTARQVGTGTSTKVPGNLIQHHPVGVDLGVALRVQNDRLIGSEVCQRDLGALRTHVNQIHHSVVIKVVFTDVSNTVH